MEVSSDSASYKQRLEVLQQQEELIEDEQEQEAKESEARRVKKEAEEEAKQVEAERKEAEEKDKIAQEKEVADEMLPEKEVRFPRVLARCAGLEEVLMRFFFGGAGGRGDG